MMRKLDFLFVVLFISYFMNLLSSCSSGSDTDTSGSISNDSLAYIMGELVGEKYHNEYVNFKYEGESVNLNKVAERCDTISRLCSNKGFIEGLWICYFTTKMCTWLHDEYNFDLSPSKLRRYTLDYLEDSSYFLSREDLSNNDFLKECINNKDSASIYEDFGGHIAGSIENLMKEKNIIFADCKNEIYNGRYYYEEMRNEPAIEGFCGFIAIEAVLTLSSVNIDEIFSQKIAADAFKKTLKDGVVNSKSEKKQLLHCKLEELLQDLEELDKQEILSIIE